MTPRRWMLGIALGCVLLMNGCRHCCKRPKCPTDPGCVPGGPGPGGPIPGGRPFTGAPTLPPQNIPLDPVPGGTSNRPSELLLPTPMQNGSSGYAPPASSKGSVALLDPDFSATPPAAVEEKQPDAKAPPPPLAVDEGPANGGLPLGISNFAQVKDDVANGMRPDLDGLDWLQSKGYKTVLFLRNGKEDDSSDRKQVEKRGMKYLSLTVTPESINPELVTEFSRIVNNTDGRPLFVYDVIGTQAGAMWYLYFRTSELLSDDQARVRAGRFGLKEQGDGEKVSLWTAVQKYLADRNSK